MVLGLGGVPYTAFHNCNSVTVAFMPAPRIEQSGPDVLLWIKAVPGASRDQISGVLGDRLKIRVAAAPEAGKANASIIALLAKSLKLKPRNLSIESGHSNPEKIVRIENAAMDDVLARLCTDG